MVDQVIFGPQTANMSLARVPNGTGDFMIQAPTFNTNNDLLIATKELEADILFDLYPNPVSQTLHLKFDPQFEHLEGHIFNTIGRLIQTFNLKDRSINVEHLNAGVYFLRVGNRTLKFIKL
jgi:hypothetical protein